MSVISPAHVEHSLAHGWHETVLTRDGVQELFLTATPRAAETIPELLSRLARSLAERETRVVNMTVINGGPTREAGLRNLSTLLGPIAWPITWMDAETSPSPALGGVEIHAICGPEVQPILVRNRVVGCTWEDPRARHCELGDLRDDHAANPAPQQTHRVIADMTAALAQAGMTFTHVYRTWFRNRDILGWYRDFNQVRTEHYHRLGVFDGLLPASTGISAANPFHAALVAGLLAMEPKQPGVHAAVVDSPLQDSARKYGSSFSRAVEVDLGDHRRLTISGTASIDRAGQTVHIGNPPAQVDMTMRVVAAILHSRGMNWTDVTRAIAYFRHPEDTPAYARWSAANGIDTLPVIISHHTVCRDDLLYEIEVDAIRCGRRP